MTTSRFDHDASRFYTHLYNELFKYSEYREPELEEPMAQLPVSNRIVEQVQGKEEQAAVWVGD